MATRDASGMKRLRPTPVRRRPDKKREPRRTASGRGRVGIARYLMAAIASRGQTATAPTESRSPMPGVRKAEPLHACRRAVKPFRHGRLRTTPAGHP
jgi:hypothetical protein